MLIRIPCPCTLRRVAFLCLCSAFRCVPVWPAASVAACVASVAAVACGLCCVPYLWRHRWRWPVENRQKENRRRKDFFRCGLWPVAAFFAFRLWPVASVAASAAACGLCLCCVPFMWWRRPVLRRFAAAVATCGGGGVSSPVPPLFPVPYSKRPKYQILQGVFKQERHHGGGVPVCRV